MPRRIISANGLTLAMKRWWWTSAPYLLGFSVAVLIAKPTPGVLAHILFPLLIFFWLTLYSSIAWTLVAAVRVVLCRRLAKADAVMLGTASIATLIGIYLEFFWTGNVG